MPDARDLHVVLLAGGSGTRFWPWSSSRRPKQMLPLAGPSPLLVDAWRRARGLAPASRVWVVAPRASSLTKECTSASGSAQSNLPSSSSV